MRLDPHVTEVRFLFVCRNPKPAEVTLSGMVMEENPELANTV